MPRGSAEWVRTPSPRTRRTPRQTAGSYPLKYPNPRLVRLLRIPSGAQVVQPRSPASRTRIEPRRRGTAPGRAVASAMPFRLEERYMKAVTWHGRRDVRVEDVPDPSLKQPNDAIVRITSSGLCGSDLHLYETLGPFMGQGDILGHEPMGIVEEVGPETGDLRVGDRVVMP